MIYMYGWLGALVLFGVAEAATAGLVTIWFAIGSLAALVAAALGAQLWLQVTIFIIVSALALVVTRPLARRFVAVKRTPTNADRVLHRQARVTETIDNIASTGAVYIEGKTWTARSADGGVIGEGELVTVESLEGVKLIVKKEEN